MMENNSLNWVNNLDRQLLATREKIENLLFRRDMGLPISPEDIRECYKKQSEILCSQKLSEKVISSNTSVPEIRRKLEIIRRKIIQARVPESSDLQYWQSHLQQEMVNFFSAKKLTPSERILTIKESPDRKNRSECYRLMGLFLSQQENSFKRMIMMSNELARKENFPDFSTAKFFSEETDLKYIKSVIAKVKKRTDKEWGKILKNIKKAVGVEEPELFDLYYGINILASQASFLPLTNFFSSLKLTVKSLGLNIDELPIKITNVVNAPPAGVYALGLSKKSHGRKIIIAINPGAGWGPYTFLFHEFGHAIYYVFSPASYLLTDPHVSREIMAEMWVSFIEQPEWFILNGFTGEGEKAKKAIEAKLIYDIFQARMQLLEAEFELEIYSNPHSDFKKVWEKLAFNILGVNDHSGVYSEFVFIHPFDIETYLLAWETKEVFIRFCQKKYGKFFGHSEILNFLISKMYKVGATVSWREKINFLA